MSRTRHYVLAAPRTWVRLQKQAIDCHVSLTRLVQHLGTMEWERVGVGDHPTIPWLKVGARPSTQGLALHQETIDQYAKIAEDMFILSASGSREWVGAVLQMYVEGRIMPVGEVTPVWKGVTSPRQNVHLSRNAVSGLRGKILPVKQLSKGLHQIAERRNQFAHSQAKGLAAGRRFPRGFRLKPDDVEFFAYRAMDLDLRPNYAQGLISWASRFLEEYGRGAIIEIPHSADTSKLSTPPGFTIVSSSAGAGDLDIDFDPQPGVPVHAG